MELTEQGKVVHTLFMADKEKKALYLKGWRKTEAGKRSEIKYRNSNHGKATRKKWRKNNPDKKSKIEKNWREKHSYEMKERRKIYNTRFLAKKFNTTVDILNSGQFGKCEICGNSPREGQTLCIDHDHKTLKFRGFLCHHCNTGLGQFKDDVDFLSKAISYLMERR